MLLYITITLSHVSRASFRAAFFYAARKRNAAGDCGQGLTGFAGSILIALYVIFCYFMLLGTKIFKAGENPWSARLKSLSLRLSFLPIARIY
jgi:hypothetical protein